MKLYLPKDLIHAEIKIKHEMNDALKFLCI